MRFSTKYKKYKGKFKDKVNTRCVLGVELNRENMLRLSQNNDRYVEMLKRVSDKYGHSIAGAVEKKLKIAIVTCNGDHHDSYRVYEKGDTKGEELFISARSCCGSEEREVEVQGIKFTVGFNYGH